MAAGGDVAAGDSPAGRDLICTPALSGALVDYPNAVGQGLEAITDTTAFATRPQ